MRPKLLLFLALAAGAAVAAAPAQESGTLEVASYELIQRKLWRDAIPVLEKEIKTLPEGQAGKQHLMLGECLYQLGQLDEAKAAFLTAQQSLAPGRDRTVAQYRLACLPYRTGDEAEGLRLTEAFAKEHPYSKHVGNLLLFKMKALVKKGPGAETQLLAVREEIAGNRRRYGPGVDVAADNILTAYYMKQGMSEKAKDRYRSIIRNFMDVSAEYKKLDRPMPAAMERGHDNAAIQLAILELNSRLYEQANRWLEIVKYDEELVARARLMLAQIAHDRRDYRLAESYLLDDDYIETVPAGAVRSDMYLLLGFCAKLAVHPKLEKVVEYFSKVEPGSTGYGQAQMGIGDTFLRWRQPDKAIEAYENAATSPKYAAKALQQLGEIAILKAEETEDAAVKDAWYKKAATSFSSLSTKYPTTREAKDSRTSIEGLIAKGYAVELGVSDEDMIRKWEQTVAASPGSGEAARALLSMARLHFKTAIDEKTGLYTKAPDYASCARACTSLLDDARYTGLGFPEERWTAMRSEALYYRGMCRLASATRTPGSEKQAVPPKFMASATVAQALADLEKAQEGIDPKEIDLLKNVEIGLLEAMLKSPDEADRKTAKERFEELVGRYGSDSRFQNLALELADWYRKRGELAAAGREYKAIADRGAGLSPDDTMKLLFTAGRLFSIAAYDARNNTRERRYGIYIYPRNVFRTPELMDTHEPLNTRIVLPWPESAAELPAEQVLRMVSSASSIPFTWSEAGGTNSVAAHLASRRLSFDVRADTVKAFLERILDPVHHTLAFDIGITGRPATLKPEEIDMEDPEKRDAARPIEILDKRYRAIRYAPLRPGYGAFRSAHGGNTMMFNVIARVEKLSGMQVLWADGVTKDDILAAEFSSVPGADAKEALPIGETLSRMLNHLDLGFRVIDRDISSELYEEAKDSFNEIRRISPRSTYGEKALFLLALNFYRQQDYERMKIVLTEYLKVFDNPTYEHFHEANFWVGWVLEHERRHREAVRYYGRAAEERLLVYRVPEGQPFPDKQEVLASFSHETSYALEEPVSGIITNYSLQPDLVDYLRINAGVVMMLDPSAAGIDSPLQHAPFQDAYIFDVAYDMLAELGLALRAENVNPGMAEKAYYRMAVCQKRDGLPRQALASARALLARYPGTERRLDTLKLQLDIYKSLKDYRNVLATLDVLAGEAGSGLPPYKIDFEKAWVYMDLCRYADAVNHFKKALGVVTDTAERLKIRDGYARSLYLGGELSEALKQYRVLREEETQPLRGYVAEMMVWYLERATGTTTSAELPVSASRIVGTYEALDEDQRGRVTRQALTQVTWAYYATGLLDLLKGDKDRALDKLQAAGNSPDDWLAAEAMYRAAMVQMEAERYEHARETIEYLLFSTRSAEAEVKAGYSLGICYRELGLAEKAKKRLEHLLEMFPDSAYAEKIQSLLKELEPEKVEEAAS